MWGPVPSVAPTSHVKTHLSPRELDGYQETKVMATRPHEDTDVPFNFGDHPQSVSGKETPLMPEPANCTVKQPADVKPSHDDIFVGGQLKEEQEPEKIWSSICGDNGDLMKDKVSAGTQIGDQTFSLNGKPGGEHNPEMDGFVEFKDCIGRKYKFPYKNVRKWKVIPCLSNSLIPIHRLPVLLGL